MDYLNAIIYGAVQGITEFLPVSSSGHLIIMHHYIVLPVANELIFDIFLHLATALAVVVFFRRYLWSLAKAMCRRLSGKKSGENTVGWLIILATLPAAAAGYFFTDMIEKELRSPAVVIVALIAVGIAFIVFEKISRATGEIDDIGWRTALIIGIAQALALIPGTSRSGITIIAGLATGLKREAAVRFSFLLSVPIVLGAFVSEIPDAAGLRLSPPEIALSLTAALASFIGGFFVIKYFLRFVQNYSLNIFAVYRFILAAVLIVYFWL